MNALAANRVFQEHVVQFGVQVRNVSHGHLVDKDFASSRVHGGFGFNLCEALFHQNVHQLFGVIVWVHRIKIIVRNLVLVIVKLESFW